MTPPTVNAFYIGTLPTLDTVQANGTMDAAGIPFGTDQVGTKRMSCWPAAPHDRPADRGCFPAACAAPAPAYASVKLQFVLGRASSAAQPVYF